MKASFQQIRNDLNELFKLIQPDLTQWEGKNLLITGGTGFFGKWFLEALSFFQEKTQTRLGRIYVLSRNPNEFIRNYPHLQNFDFIQGDIRSFNFPNSKIHGIIHGATAASAKLNTDSPQEMYETIVEGTRRALLCAKESPNCRFLMISSGAVYGKKKLSDGPSKEEDFVFSDQAILGDAYADGKRKAEALAASNEFSQSAAIARCFAFVGPYLPLKLHFAVGNFIADCLAGNPIIIKGDGTPLRTYLYPTDLISWLLAVFSRGEKNRSYNVGSDVMISIEQLANLVQKEAMQMGLSDNSVKVRQTPKPNEAPACYAPTVQRAVKELGLNITVDLRDSIRRTIRHHLEQV